MIVFDVEALQDLERIFEHNFERAPDTAMDHVDRIRSAIEILEVHPRIGRPIQPRSDLRELVISYGKSGYIALYAHSQIEGLIRIVAIRHQLEAGYRDQ